MANRWQYAEAGISKLQLVKPLYFLLNVLKFKLPATPGLRILRVSKCYFFSTDLNNENLDIAILLLAFSIRNLILDALTVFIRISLL